MADKHEAPFDQPIVDHAPDAWEAFYRLYWRPILGYARRFGLKAAEAETVLQETMVALMQRLPAPASEQRNGRAPDFLFAIVHEKTRRAVARRGGSGAPDADGDASTNGTRCCAHAADRIDASAVDIWRSVLLRAALHEGRQRTRGAEGNNGARPLPCRD